MTFLKKHLWLLPLVITCLLGFFVVQNLLPRLSKKNPTPSVSGKFTDLGVVENGSLHLSDVLLTNSVNRFKVKIDPKTFSALKLSLKFSPSASEIQLGSRSSESDPFHYLPIYNRALDGLNWQKISRSGLTLWQKNPTYTTVDQFITQPPAVNNFSYYGLSQSDLTQPNLKATQTTSSINTPLRGNHTFYFPVVSTSLHLELKKQDLNIYEGPDTLKAVLYRDDSYIATASLPDDGLVTKDGLKSLPQSTVIDLASVKPGLYRLEVTIGGQGSDSTIYSLSVNQPKLVVAKSVFLLGTKPSTVYTEAASFTAQTFHPAAIQTLELDKTQKLPLAKISTVYPATFTKAATLHQITSPKDDVTLVNEGYFAFSPDSYFLPEIVKTISINDFIDSTMLSNSLDMVLTNMPDFWTDGNYRQTEFTLTSADFNSISDGYLYFSLDVPHLEKFGGSLELKNLDLSLVGGIPTPTNAPILQSTSTPAPTLPAKASATAGPTSVPTSTGEPACVVNDQKILVGQSFYAADNCNICSCSSTLQIVCTNIKCK